MPTLRALSSMATRRWSKLWADRDGLPLPTEPSPKIPEIGVWAGRSAIKNPVREVAAAAQMGIGHLHLMVNDHSAQRRPLPSFMAAPTRGLATATPSSLLAVARECRRHSICLHLTTWVMPWDAYVDGMLDYMGEVGDLVESVSPIQSVVIDAEEPWTRSPFEPGGYRRAAQRIRQGLTRRDLRMGVTGIGFFPNALRPLLEVADYGIPQCYLTTGGRLRPSGAAKAIEKWQRGTAGDLEIGLAGYRTTPAIMHQGFEIAASRPTIWWSLNSLRRSRSRRAAMREIAGV